MSGVPLPTETHISSVRFRMPFEKVWTSLTDPLRFPRLYPTWTAHVEAGDQPGTFKGIGPAGDSFTIVPRLGHDHGVIDFEVRDAGGHVEVSRARLFPLKDGGCLLVHLAERWEGVDDEGWVRHQQGTDADLENARRLVEVDLASS